MNGIIRRGRVNTMYQTGLTCIGSGVIAVIGAGLDMYQTGLICIGSGVIAVIGAGFDWDWFMNHRKTQFFNRIFGRTGARIVYALLGTSLIVLGIMLALGIIRDARQ